MINMVDEIIAWSHNIYVWNISTIAVPGLNPFDNVMTFF